MSDVMRDLMKGAGGSRGEAAFVAANYNKDGVPVEIVGLPDFARECLEFLLREAVLCGMRIATNVPIEQVPAAVDAAVRAALKGADHE
jgi:hypothetical protein